MESIGKRLEAVVFFIFLFPELILNILVNNTQKCFFKSSIINVKLKCILMHWFLAFVSLLFHPNELMLKQFNIYHNAGHIECT